MKRVLITGGAGFVGRWLTRSVLADGFEAWIVDDLSTGLDPEVWLGAPGQTSADGVCRYEVGEGSIVFVRADAVAFFGAQLAMPGFDAALGRIEVPTFDEAFHLASVVGGRVKIESQPVHVGIDLAIDSVFALWVAESRKVERLLYASSSAAYPIENQGEEGALALTENLIDFGNAHIRMPDFTYGWSKLTGEYLTHLLAEVNGLPCCCVRPFSGYGEDQDLNYPVPAIARRVALHEDPLTVWGTGKQGRDFVHISDCIRAMRLAIATIEDGSAVNIGSGSLTDFLTVAALFAQLEGYEPEIRGTSTGPVGVHARYASPDHAFDRIGFRPEVSLEEGMSRVLGYQHEQLREPSLP